MQVILQKSVTHLGLVGDVVTVAAGYFRNYLAPRNLALIAHPENIKQLEHQKRIVESKKAKEKEAADKLKEKLEASPIQLAHSAGSGDKLFGSVTSQEIAHGLREAGFNVDRKLIKLPEPIKSLGAYEIEIKLHPDVFASVKVEVIKKKIKSDGSSQDQPKSKPDQGKGSSPEHRGRAGCYCFYPHRQ